MTPALDDLIAKAVQALSDQLGSNFYSCCLYGSAVRGNFIEGVSDINLLIVLNESNPRAHESVANAIGAEKQIDPFILGRPGFVRSARAFAAKFDSIKRNYRVLRGADPLAEITIDPVLERFLCEQALRNLRLRMVYAFVTRSRTKSYGRFILRSVTPIFVQFSEVLRLEGLSVPTEFGARVPAMEKTFGISGAVLRDLLAARQKGKDLDSGDAERWHERLFPAVDAVVQWVEAKWTAK
jgi:predicted nucleotidyltransferase